MVIMRTHQTVRKLNMAVNGKLSESCVLHIVGSVSMLTVKITVRTYARGELFWKPPTQGGPRASTAFYPPEARVFLNRSTPKNQPQPPTLRPSSLGMLRLWIFPEALSSRDNFPNILFLLKLLVSIYM